MKIVIAFVGLFAVASASIAILPATTLIRSPSDDSAIVQSERIGGSFAYSTLEGHAYKAITPVLSPVYTTYHLRSALPLTTYAVAPQIIYQQPAVFAGPALVAAPAATAETPAPVEPESRSDEEPQPEPEKKDEGSSLEGVSVEAN